MITSSSRSLTPLASAHSISAAGWSGGGGTAGGAAGSASCADGSDADDGWEDTPAIYAVGAGFPIAPREPSFHCDEPINPGAHTAAPARARDGSNQ